MRPTAAGVPPGIRQLLLLLLLGCLLPGALSSVALVIHQYREAAAQAESGTRQTAKALVQSVDNRLEQAVVLGQSLAASETLARGDLASFHHEAANAIRKLPIATNVLLLDRSGQQLMNTAVPFGQALPRSTNEAIERTFVSRQAVVSNLFVGELLHQPIVAAIIPVLRRREVVQVLAIGILVPQFNQLLALQRLPPDWRVAVLDGAGTFVARTHDPGSFVGQKPPAELLQALATQDVGTL
ncbi:MAG: cache domain-containing protein [Rubrivivax sp.]